MNALRQQISKSSARVEDQDRPKRPKSAGMGLSALRSRSAATFDSNWRRRRNSSATPPLADPVHTNRSRQGSQASASSASSGHLNAMHSYKSKNSHDSGTTSMRSSVSHESRNHESHTDEAVRRRLASFFFWDASSHSHLPKMPGSKDSSTSNSIDKEFDDPTDLEPPPAPQTPVSQPPSTLPFPMLRSRSNYSAKNLSIGVSDANARRATAVGPSTPTLFVDGATDTPRSRRRTEESGSRSRSSSLNLGFGFGNKSSPSSASIARHSSSSDDLRWRQELPLPPPPTAGFGAQNDMETAALGLDPAAVRYADHIHALGYTRNKYVCALLAKENRDGIKFNNMVMQAYILRMMRFAGEPLDMSLRKLLYRVALPQETQQIERVLQAFSVLWNFENPGLFADPEQVLFVVFSLVIVHTDMFNRSVKHKMAKADYLQYASTEGVAPEILEYFYDNITATVFREYRDDDDLIMPMAPPSPNAAAITTSIATGVDPSPVQTPSDTLAPPLPYVPHTSEDNKDTHSLSSKKSGSMSWSRDLHPDPYPYLLENGLDALRPALTSIVGESTCDTVPLGSPAELEAIEKNFTKPAAYIQLVSQRSRPDAYIDGNDEVMLQAQSRPGIIEIGVVKHGILLRREPKKLLAVAKPPAWKEWGAVLTESRLYLFKNAAFVKLMSTASDGTLRASVETLNQATTFSTRDMAAITRARSTRNHDDKYEFMLVEGGRDSANQQWFALDSQEELASWVQTINVAATQATFAVSLANTRDCTPNSLGTDSRHSSVASINAASVAGQLEEVDRQLDAVEDQIHWYMRTFRHLRLLAPIQQRTRETLVFAAGRYSSKCDAAFVKQQRLRCYKNVLSQAAAIGSHLAPLE